MKKILSMLLCLTLIIAVVGCSNGKKLTDIQSVEQLIRTEKYEEATKAAKKILDADEYNIEARDLIATIYIKSEDYDMANDWLEEYLDFVDENLENSDLDVKKAVDSIGDLARDILRKGEKVGSWYEKLKPEALVVEEYESVYDIGDVLEFDVPKGTELLYNYDGGSPKSEGIVYKDGIAFEEEGYFFLELILMNKYGEYSKLTSMNIDVVDPNFSYDDGGDTIDYGDITLVPPRLDIEEGTYYEAMDLVVLNYDESNPNLSIIYTTDGSDPTDYMNLTRDYYGYIPISAGEYNIAIVAYDMNTYEYSDVAYYNYDIQHTDTIHLGLYGLPDVSVEAYRQMFDDAGFYDVYVEPVVYKDLNSIDLNNLPDALISYGSYAKELADYGIAANVNAVFDISSYDYIANALDIGTYNGVAYMMPLTIRPEYLVYGDYSGIGYLTWDYLKGQADWLDYKFAFAADNPEMFLGIYYGLGGPVIDPASENPSLDKGKLVEALTMIQSMPNEGIGNQLYTMDELTSLMYNYSVEYFVSNDFVERSADYSYDQVGAMPLKNGKTARYYNTATGLFVSNYALAMNPSLKGTLSNLYEFLIYDNYQMLNVASVEGALPTTQTQIEEFEYYTYIPIDEYIGIVENGISKMKSVGLNKVYDALSGPLNDLLNDVTPEAVADNILNNLK